MSAVFDFGQYKVESNGHTYTVFCRDEKGKWHDEAIGLPTFTSAKELGQKMIAIYRLQIARRERQEGYAITN